MLAALALALAQDAAPQEPTPLDPHRVTVDVDSWIHMCAQLSYLAMMRVSSAEAGGLELKYGDEDVARIQLWLTERGPKRLATEFREVFDQARTGSHPITAHLGGQREGEVELFLLEDGHRVDVWARLAVPSFISTDPDNVFGLELSYTWADGDWSLAKIPEVAYTLMGTVDLPECRELPYLGLEDAEVFLTVRYYRTGRIPVAVRSWHAARGKTIPASGPWFDIIDAEDRALPDDGPLPRATRVGLKVSAELPTPRLRQILRSLAVEHGKPVLVTLSVEEIRVSAIREPSNRDSAPPRPPELDAEPLEPGTPGTKTWRSPFGRIPLHLPWGYADQESAAKVRAGTTRDALDTLFPKGVPERVCIVHGTEETVQDVVTTAAALLHEGAKEVHLRVFRPGEEPTGPRIDPDDDF